MTDLSGRGNRRCTQAGDELLPFCYPWLVDAAAGVMADIFVSYKSEDRERARLVAQALQAEGFDVWWDPALQAGEDYQEVIDRNLREALVVVVLWTPLSVKSRWVRSEATIGDRYGALAPAIIDACDLPTAFVLVQTADLSQWSGDRTNSKWREFAADVAAKRDKRRTERVNHTAAPPPDANAIESLFWQSIKDSVEAPDFQSYLRRYPSGHFAELAQNRLAALRAPRLARDAYDEADSKKPGQSRIALMGTFAVLAIAAIVAAVVLFGRGGQSQSVAEGEATIAEDVAGVAGPLIGSWAPSGLTCNDAVTIGVADSRLSIDYGGGAPSFETIVRRDPDGTIVTSAGGASFAYSLSGETLILRSPDGSTASYSKCDG